MTLPATGRNASAAQLESIPNQPPTTHRAVAAKLISVGLAHVTTHDAPRMAHDIAEALGLIPTPPPTNPPRKH